MSKDNPISRGIELYTKYIPNPLVHAALVGGSLWGLTRLAWNPLIETARSLGRLPAKKITGMSDEEYDEALNEFKSDSKLKTWAPLLTGMIAGGLALTPHLSPFRRNYGTTSWNAASRSYVDTDNNNIIPATTVNKIASLKKRAEDDDLFMYGGYVPQMDFTETLNARKAQSLFTNDPYLQNMPYTRNMGTAIIADAANRSGSNNTTLGSVFDSAVDKLNNKLSFGGVLTTGVQTAVANGLARCFTEAVGSVMDMSPTTRQNIIDAGTWAGAINSILN